MQLSELIQDTSLSRETNTRIQPFDLDILKEAFQLRETAPVDLPPSEKGTPTVAGKSRSESKDKEKKHKSTRTKTKTRTRIKSTRSTSIGIKIEKANKEREEKR
ncbi:UNVERIFIED_CONTAM: Mediator of RNA polymerase II transcription subunita [Sesamum calycinum]|uniref:Mediator of RNA polymerase II transcription subunita n=1 Tax=Sesamum calycinum TaxID=2727403 RepID=A0AAW2SF62_9LAMI